MAAEHRTVADIIAAELARSAPAEALSFAAAIRRRHGDAVAAILFYGSCLRTHHFAGGVLDFYVLVDDYRAAYTSRFLAWANALLPPNVFYLEIPDGDATLRAKYAVMSSADFAAAATPHGVHSIIWARFCQPALLVYARDESSRVAVIGAVAQSVLTMVTRMVPLLPATGTQQRFQMSQLWQHGFAETYRTELRPERAETIRALYEAAPNRYDQVTYAALRALKHQGVLDFSVEESWVDIIMPARQRRSARSAWHMRRPLAKVLYAVRLLKSAATFGDWLPYVLWKLERHTGVHIEPTARQRAHPFIWGWPVILKLLLRRALR
jgi:hypothetical protein